MSKMEVLALAIRAYGPVDLDNFAAAYQRHMVAQRGPFEYAKFLYVNGRPSEAPHWVKMDGCLYLQSTEAFLRTVLETLEKEAFSDGPVKRRRMWENLL